MRPPLIGITTERKDTRRDKTKVLLNEVYISSLLIAGAIPVMVPSIMADGELTEMLSRLDGVLFSGGGDMAPECYGNPPHPKVAGVDPERDRAEIELFRQVTAKRAPFLGICRGLQVINVALGGKLYEDITDQRPGALEHQAPRRWRRDRLTHPVRVERSSKLYEVLGQEETWVNSHHHQGISLPAAGIKITATAPDGIIEAFELEGYPFGVAVQWHPEWMPDVPAMRNLFNAFVTAASRGETGLP